MIKAKPKVFIKAGKQRYGKGFSREELKRAGLSLKEALRFGIPVDSRRKTVHEENVEVAKTFLESKKVESKFKGKSKS
jgi:large subunit ribosomal protein L13e